MFRIAALSLTVLFAAVGCNAQISNVGSETWLPQSNAQGRIEGDLPIVGAFDDDQADVAYIDPWEGETYLRLDSIDEAGWAMIGFTVHDEDLAGGQPVDVDPEYAQGCSGSEAGVADFDENPETLTVTKELAIELDGSRSALYKVVAVFADGSRVEGQVQPEPQPDPDSE